LACNDEDRRLVEAIHKEVLEITPRRNRLMHDSCTASRTRTRSSGAQVEVVSTESLDSDSDYMKSLTDAAGTIQLVQWQVEPPQSNDPDLLLYARQAKQVLQGSDLLFLELALGL
jgi:hypothetical protein